MGYFRGIVFIASLAAAPAAAYEVDNFTGRDMALPDSLTKLNIRTNRLLDEAVASANAAGPCTDPATATGASMPAIYEHVRNHLDSNPVATIEQWAAEHLPAANRFAPDFDGSIYADMSITDGFVLRMAELEPSIRLNGQYVGVDKLGHFMAQGYEYFERVWRSGRVGDALSYGRGLEDGMYGMETTGVRSYGDLAANFGGMTFYRDLLYGARPILVCDGGRWRRERPFDWADYVNAGWDEATNCSEFNSGLRAAVNRGLAARRISCPVAPVDCRPLAALPCGTSYISPVCQAQWISSFASSACPTDLPGLPSRTGAPVAPPPVSGAPLGPPGQACPPGSPPATGSAGPATLQESLESITGEMAP
jgi:hypothetical protein